MRTHERIDTNPDVMFGKSVVRGTRITVEQILRELGEGLAVAEVIEAHPRLTPEDVQAAQTFAADYLAEKELHSAA